MNKKCTICGRTDMKTDNFCKLCHTMVAAMYSKYTTKQIMAMYSHVLGLKVVQEITDITYDTLKSQYEAEKLKEGGRLN
jgi:hypothetical protein